MRHEVLLTEQAVRDLEDIHAFVEARDSLDQAEAVLAQLEQAVLGLERLPGRGHCPPELERVGVLEFREINQGPWRILYRIRNRSVFVYCVLDGRRDMAAELERRMLRL